MRLKQAVALVTVASFMFALAAPNVYAADRHSASSAQLHQAVQASHAKVAASRKGMDDLLARADVQSQLRLLGLTPEKVRAQVSQLGDTEIVRLHQQVMSAELQQAEHGLSAGAIVAIVIAGVVGLILLAWLLYHYSDETIYYY
jgi:hypothetical protein